MPDYQFKDRHLGISKEGIHLLHNGYNYDTIAYKDISHAEIGWGNALKNRGILLAAGIIMLIFTALAIRGIIRAYNDPMTRTIYIEGLLLPLFPLLLGAYSTYMALRKETILIVQAKKSLKFSLTSFKNKDELEPLRKYLSGKVNLRG